MSLYDTDSPTMAIARAFITPNETDSNGEPANVVDGLFAIARSIGDLAAAVRESAPDPDVQMHNAERLAKAVTRIAHGGIEGPTGLEMLSMAINGGRDHDWPSITGAITEGFETLATAIRETQED